MKKILALPLLLSSLTAQSVFAKADFLAKGDDVRDCHIL
jgi:hypothetical protein